jgi:hypothetical protein
MHQRGLADSLADVARTSSECALAANSAVDRPAPIAAPTSWATTNAGTWLIAMPAKVVVKPRASVTAGLANEVDAVNQ